MLLARSAQECHAARRGVREGSWTFWYPGGGLRQRGGYLGGLKEGEWFLWHENGGLRSRGAYRADERVGEWCHWPPDPPVLEDPEAATQ